MIPAKMEEKAMVPKKRMAVDLDPAFASKDCVNMTKDMMTNLM
jgi:hypothetical protein